MPPPTTYIRFDRFGPVLSAEIELKPLSLLFGPNASGKSYLATGVAAIRTVLSRFSGSYAHGRPYVVTYRARRGPGKFARYLPQTDAQRPGSASVMLSEEAATAAMEDGWSQVGEEIVRELESAFATPPADLISFGSRNFKITITVGDRSFSITYWKNRGPSFDVDAEPPLVHVGPGRPAPGGDVHVDPGSLPFPPSWLLKAPRPEYVAEIADAISLEVSTQLLQGVGRRTHILPANRSGFLQSYDVLASGAFQEISMVGLRRIEYPAFSGVVARFLATIAESADRGKGDFDELARKIEAGILSAHLVVRRTARGPVSFELEYPGGRIPLYRGSTGAAQLAPMILFCQHVLKKGDALVVEEPEAHLHPRAQVDVMGALIEMQRNDVDVIATTHADYLVQALNAQLRKSEGTAERVFAARLVQTEEGFELRRLKVDAVDGIPLDEFLDVQDALLR